MGRTLGAGDTDRGRRQVADSLLLALIVMTGLAGLAGALMAPLFDLLGAEPGLRPLIRAYMVPWLIGVPLLVVTMVGNSALRASGDTLTPSVIMALGGLINGLLDPLLIFGWGPVPGSGLQGAALASLASWIVVLAVNQYWLTHRPVLVTWYRPGVKELLASWRAHLRISLPAAGSNVMPPLANGALTALVAQHGAAAVAGFGVGIRIEAFALVVALAFAGAL
ncbi:MAG: MATE family efflux transporter, partial [Thiohalorhabdaceae bacterium]